MRRPSLVMGTRRENATITLVAGLAGFYAAALAMVADVMSRLPGQAAQVNIVLSSAASVFIGIALYVAVVVMSGCVAAVIAGRLQAIALLRLLGTDARTLRRAVVRSSARFAAQGGGIGVALGVAMVDVARRQLVALDRLPAAPYPWVSVPALLTLLPIIGAAAIAGLLGSRRVLEVAPVQAMSGPAAARETQTVARWRAPTALTLVLAGGGLLGLGAALGERGSSTGFIVAFLGSATSLGGLLVGAPLVLPGAVRLVGCLLGDAPVSRLARRTTVADPLRTTRSTLGLVIGVALVTTFSSGLTALRVAISRTEMDPVQRALAARIITATTAVMVAVVIISAVIAAVGFISTQSSTVIQRRRELGLLRALGFTRAQIRSMITRESIALGTTAVLTGITLGLLYGSLGAQALIGAKTPGFAWGLPPATLALTVGCSALLVLAASQPPAARAVRATPVEALRLED